MFQLYLEKKKFKKPLKKRIVDISWCHAGRVPMFSHLKMELVKDFSKPQRRIAGEGVSISIWIL